MLAADHEAVHCSEVGDPRAHETALMQGAMANGFPVPLSYLQPSHMDAIEDWPWLDQDVLRSSRSRQVCMTCHFFRHHPGPNCIPPLTCHLHQGLIAHGEHLTQRCQGSTDDLVRQRGWAPRARLSSRSMHVSDRKRPPLSTQEDYISDGRHVFHFRPTRLSGPEPLPELL